MSSRPLALLTIAASVLVAGCTNPRADDDRSAVTLVASIEGEGEGASGRIFDVVSDTGTVTDEFLDLRLDSVPKAPSGPGLSPLYEIVIQGIEVRYSRLVGANIPGVDVPFPLRYALGGTVPSAGTATVQFLAVTQEAKLQAPLRNLWFGEGQRLFVTMTVTVFGVDRLDNQVQASASTVLIFGDN